MTVRSFKYSALALVVAGGLAACGGSSNNPPVAEDLSLGDQRQWVGVQGVLPASDPDGDDLSVTFMENDSIVGLNDDGYYEFSHGLLEFSRTTMEFTYVPLGTGEGHSIQYSASDGSLEDEGEIEIGYIAGDPLANEQWHLRNTGQTGFAMQDETFEAWRELRVAQGFTEEEAEEMVPRQDGIRVPGEDLNVVGALKHGVTGDGMTVVVVDQGLALQHEDLRANILPGRSINFIADAVDRTDPTVLGNGGDHGTSVAGLIAAEGWNGLGGRGVAPDASLIGMNFLGGGTTQTDRNLMMAHGMAGSGISSSENLIAFNRSYGRSAPLAFTVDEIDEAMFAYPTEQLRDGLGALNIKSSGNSFSGAPGYPEAAQLCDLAQAGLREGVSRVLSCLDGNWDPANASFHTISVGALNPNGGLTTYSTTGSNLLVSAPAGEFGDFLPAMITADQTTCTRGYSGWPAYDAFMDDNGDFLAGLGIDNFHGKWYPFNSPMGDLNSELNPGCNYTNTFNGTSSAAPNVSGVVALIAEANPELSWREIRYILAATSTQVAQWDAPVELVVGDDTFVAHEGWVENAAGYSFNNRFGFGRPDAGAAVEMAMSGSVSLPELVETDWMFAELEESVAIPDNNAEGVSLELTVSDEVTIEGMQFAFDIFNQDLVETFEDNQSGSTAASDIAIEVTSPEGTTSVIASSRTSMGAFRGLGNGSFIGYSYVVEAPILTNAFLGESAEGTWTVRFVDTNGADLGPFLNNSQDSEIENVAVRIFGH